MTELRSDKRQRPIILATRVTRDENNRIIAEAYARGLSVSAFLRQSALACAR